MTNFNFGRFFSFLLFLAFAGISVWATAESFHLSLDTWPKVLCWVMAGGFMVVASIGTKLIVDSLNQDIDVDNRGWQFVGGIILLLAFWIVCSMPTNTHTFFYRSDIHRVVNDDIATTEAYLQQLEGFTVNANYKTEKINNLKAQVELKLGELEGEIRNEANPGFGTKSKQILREFASLLDMPKMEQLSVGQNASRQQIIDAYRSKIYALRDAKIREIQNETEAAESSLFKNKAKEHLAELRNVRIAIDTGAVDLNIAEQVAAVEKVIDRAYKTIGSYSEFVNFKGHDKEIYAPTDGKEAITKVKSTVSVYNVWKDMLTTNKYEGHGLWFWVVIAILVDVAAFIFFDIAFARREDDI